MLFATPSLINLQCCTKIMFFHYRAQCTYHQRRNKPSIISIPTLITKTAGRRRDGIQSWYSSSSHSTVLFTNNDSTQSTEDTIHHDSYPSNKFDDYDYLLENPSSLQPQHVNAHHWFTELLPEGWCVGVISGHAPSSSSGMMMIDETETTTTTTHVKTSPPNYLLLHPDEHRWGIDHITSDTSRTSYYLGRIALRSSMSVLLDNNYSQININSSSMELADDDSSSSSSNNYYYYCTQLKDQIRNMAINKDTHGRPILPNIISGSISHKGRYAVGLSTFHSSTKPIISHAINLDRSDVATSIAWQEECPLLDDDDQVGSLLSSNNSNNNNSRPSSTNVVVHGVGIDLECIDGSRGERIKRKVLTENEVHQLGGLKAIGISCDEEVILRFSLKESVYKAMHPLLCQYVGFHEAEITPLMDGSASVSLQLVHGPNNIDIVVHSASWKKIGDDFFLTSALVGTAQ